MARTLDINKIKTYTEGIINDALKLISSVNRELVSDVTEVYQFMADNCRNYHNELKPQDYINRACIYTRSVLQLCEAHGIQVAERTKKKLTNNINDLVQFTQNTWYQAGDAREAAKRKELTACQKDLIHNATELIAQGICAVAIYATVASASVSIAMISNAIMSSAVVLASPVLMSAATVSVSLSPVVIPLVAFITAPVIYSIYNDICKFKAQSPQQNMTSQKLYDIATSAHHFDKGMKLINEKLESALSAFSKNIEPVLESGLKKAIVAKEVTKSVGNNLSQAVSRSKVGKGIRKVQDITRRAAIKVNKFTELAGSKVTSSPNSRTR